MEPDEVAAKDLTLITITPADSPLQQARNLESPSNKKESYLLLNVPNPDFATIFRQQAPKTFESSMLDAKHQDSCKSLLLPQQNMSLEGTKNVHCREVPKRFEATEKISNVRIAKGLNTPASMLRTPPKDPTGPCLLALRGNHCTTQQRSRRDLGPTRSAARDCCKLLGGPRSYLYQILIPKKPQLADKILLRPIYTSAG